MLNVALLVGATWLAISFLFCLLLARGSTAAARTRAAMRPASHLRCQSRASPGGKR
jgi:hypothetical protein